MFKSQIQNKLFEKKKFWQHLQIILIIMFEKYPVDEHTYF